MSTTNIADAADPALNPWMEKPLILEQLDALEQHLAELDDSARACLALADGSNLMTRYAGELAGAVSSFAERVNAARVVAQRLPDAAQARPAMRQ